MSLPDDEIREKATTGPPAAVLAILAAIIGFAVVSAFAAEHDRFPGDLWATEQVQTLDNDAIDSVIDITEDIGDDPIVIVVWIGAGALFYFLAGWTPPALLGLAGALRMLVPLLKEIIERPRPSPDLVEVSEFPGTFSFPSGHASTAMILFALVFYFTQLYVRPAAARLAVQAFCVWMIVVVGIERVYAGEHWPSDVIGGFWFGGIVVAVVVLLHRHLERRAADQRPK